MKALNKILRILAVVFGAGTLVLFFVPFANIVTNGITVSPVAAQLAFGGKITVAKEVYSLAVSSHIQFTFWLAVISVVLSVFAFKSKGFRYGSSAFSLTTAIYLLVIALKKGFVDVRPLEKVTSVTHTNFVLILAIVALVFAACAIAHLFIDDYIEAKSSKDKKTIMQKVVLFFRDNKSEVKKIVWPGFKDVRNNTITVIVMCLVIGALIWAIDFGLGKLLELIIGA